MPPRSKKSPTRIELLEEKNKELEEELRSVRRKSKKVIDKFAEFQEEVGGSIIPYQKLGLYIGSGILFLVGLSLIIYAATHPDLDILEEYDEDSYTRESFYITGGILMGFAVLALLIGLYWFRTVKKSPGLKKLNATMFEIELAKDVFSR